MRKFIFIVIFLTISFEGFSQLKVFPLDTNYLPVQKFQVEFNNRKWVDSIGVYFDIQYLKAFDEPPMYCCRTDSSIRILTVPSFQPATIIELFKQNPRYIFRIKESNKVGLDYSYLNPEILNKKDRKRFYELSNQKIPQTEWSINDQSIYEKAIVKDTDVFSYTTQEIEISAIQWNDIFNILNNQFYQLETKPKQFSAVMDGYSRLIEIVTKNGYMVLSRGSAFPEEHIVRELMNKIENQGE